MKKEFDKIVRENLEDLEIQPNPESKHIFLKSISQKKKTNALLKALISAAVVLLLVLLKIVYQGSADSDVIHPLELEEVEHIAAEEFQQEINLSEQAEAPKVVAQKIHSTDRPKSQTLRGEGDSLRLHGHLALNEGVHNPVEHIALNDSEDMQPSEPEIEVRITGIAEQILYAVQQEIHSQKREISMKIGHQKFTIPAPIVDDVEQTLNQVKNGISNFNLAEVGKSLTYPFSNRLNIKKNPSQKPE